MSHSKIAWAFDPYSDVKDIWLQVASALAAFQNRNSAEIHPIYFIDDQYMDWYGQTLPQQIDPLKDILREVMKSHLKDFSKVELQEPEVVYSPSTSQRSLARFVAKYLKEQDFDLVALSTHARKGLKRAFFGSFAETLLWNCPVPQLVVPPSSREVSSIDKILYPTETSDESFQLFKKFLDLDYGRGTRIDLYSKMVAPSETYAKAMVTALGGGWMTLEGYSDQETKKIEQRLESWKAIGQHQGAQVHTYIDSPQGQTGDRILHACEELGSDLIVMPTFASRVDAILVGSRTLDVVRNSSVPVLIQHF